MPRTTSRKSGKDRHDPLHVELDADATFAKYGRVSKPGKRAKTGKTDDENGVDPEATVWSNLCEDGNA